MTPFKKFLVLILSTLEGWKVESTLEPPGGFKHGTPGLEHWTPELQKSRYLKTKTVFFLQTKKNHQLHIKGYFMTKNSYVVELTFQGFWINLWLFDFLYSVFPVWNICRKFHFASMNVSKVIAWRKLKKSQDFWNFNSTKVSLTFHPSEVVKMSTRSFQEVSGKK